MYQCGMCRLGDRWPRVRNLRYRACCRVQGARVRGWGAHCGCSGSRHRVRSLDASTCSWVSPYLLPSRASVMAACYALHLTEPRHLSEKETADHSTTAPQHHCPYHAAALFPAVPLLSHSPSFPTPLAPLGPISLSIDSLIYLSMRRRLCFPTHAHTQTRTRTHAHTQPEGAGIGNSTSGEILAHVQLQDVLRAFA